MLPLLAIVCLVQAIDNRYCPWSARLLDYSTHTAFALALVFYRLDAKPQLRDVVILSFLLYMLLVPYQQYHTLSDILSTALVLGPLMWFVVFYSKQRIRALKKKHLKDSGYKAREV